MNHVLAENHVLAGLGVLAGIVLLTVTIMAVWWWWPARRENVGPVDPEPTEPDFPPVSGVLDLAEHTRAANAETRVELFVLPLRIPPYLTDARPLQLATRQERTR
jgi:hypothetical protein